MNSLASLVTQGQIQVTPAGSYLMIGIWNRSQKTSFKNVKSFSRYLEKSNGMSCFGIRKTAQITLQSMQIWYLSQMLHFFWPRMHGIGSLVISLFFGVPTNVSKRFHAKISNDFENLANFQRPCQGKFARYFVFHSFPELTCTQTF